MKINLSKNETFFINENARDVSIRCNSGSLWVTQPNDEQDHILRNGEVFTTTQKGKVVVLAIRDSIVSFSKLDLYHSKNCGGILIKSCT